MTDETLMSMLKESRLLALDNLYDKYAPAMYGLVLNLTNDKTLAEEIFVAAFVDLGDKQNFLKVNDSLLPDLMRHTYLYTKKQLVQPHNSGVEMFEEGSTTVFLAGKCTSLSEVAYILGISEEEAKKRLRLELIHLRKNT